MIDYCGGDLAFSSDYEHLTTKSKADVLRSYLGFVTEALEEIIDPLLDECEICGLPFENSDNMSICPDCMEKIDG